MYVKADHYEEHLDKRWRSGRLGISTMMKGFGLHATAGLSGIEETWKPHWIFTGELGPDGVYARIKFLGERHSTGLARR